MSYRLIVGLCFSLAVSPAAAATTTVQKDVTTDPVVSLANAYGDGLVYDALPNENAIYVYEQRPESGDGHKRKPVGILTTGINGPTGMFVHHGDLYVTNFGSASIVVFHKRASSPYKTLTVPSKTPFEVNVDRRGTVYVLAFERSERPKLIYVFANGSTTPTATLRTRYQPGRLATNDSGDLFVLPDIGGKVEEFTFRSNRPRSKLLGVGTSFAGGLALDSSGNLIVVKETDNAHGGGGVVSVYAPPYSGPPIYAREFFPTIYAAALNRVDGSIWLTTECACLFHSGVPHIIKLSPDLKYREEITLPDYGDGIAVDSDI